MSCIHLPDIISHKDMRHSEPEESFPNRDTQRMDTLQPLHVKCPICTAEGFYIQSLYVQSIRPGVTNVLHSQYVCTNNHEWLIGQNVVGGPVLPGRRMIE